MQALQGQLSDRHKNREMLRAVCGKMLHKLRGVLINKYINNEVNNYSEAGHK